MLYAALVVSIFLLLVSNLIVWNAKRPGLKIIGTAAVIALAPIGLGIFLTPVVFQAALLSVVVLIWTARQGERRTFFRFSCAITLMAFAVPGYFAFRETRHMQQEFPYLSMETRLPEPRMPHPEGTLPLQTGHRVEAMESLVEQESKKWMSYYRTYSLRQIHEDSVRVFAMQPGFGVARMTGISAESLKRGARQQPPLAQPGIPSPSSWSPELLRKSPTGKAIDGLLSFHDESVLDFANVSGFGYLKDRRHVAGFQEHQVSQTPTPPRRWALQRLDLVGLVVHKDPTAYVSDHLPRMEELRAAPTRCLDEFETAGLPALQTGEDLFIREREGECRMLGAIRAARQCVSCHGGERGDLLGAFSYRLTPDQKLTER